MSKPKGFTLVAAAVAISVLAILATLIVPLMVKSRQAAQVARAKHDLQIIAAALAQQLKDTGCRPTATGGPGGSTGAGEAVWHSLGAVPAVPGGVAPFTAGDANTLANLFGAPNTATSSTRAQANALFGFPADLTDRAEYAYKGPYLSQDLAIKADPWGTAYFILGYNANSQNHDGPLWVVSAGPSRVILPANLTPGPDHRYRQAWDLTGLSATNLAVRVN